MAGDEFCAVDFYPDEWSPKAPAAPQWHARPFDKTGRPRQDAIARLLELLWEVPSDNCTVVEEELSLAERFREQADKWESETGHFSSPTQRIAHPSYQAILGMGSEHKDKILRLLLNDLKQNRRAWFWALSYLAQDNPIKSSDAGKIDKMIEAWLNWGKEKRLL
jgi:hypothetical protein